VLKKQLFALCFLLVLCQTSVLAGATDEKRLSFTVPGAPWTLTLPKDDFVIEKQQIKPDGRYGYFLVSDSKNGWAISLFIEPALECKGSRACRDMVWKAGNPSWESPQNIVQSAIGDVSYFEFLVPSFQGVPVRQQNMYAEFVVEDFWVDLHISKTLYQPQEHELFEQIVKAIKFEPKSKPR
jgi:hypothetical protein